MEREHFEQNRQDSYRSKSKPVGTPQCPSCRSISVRGRWYDEQSARKKLPRSYEASQLTCPACRQLNDHYAMGVVELHGKAWAEKSQEIFETIEHSERIAQVRNNQHRILWSESRRGITKIYVTLPELARHLGRILEKTFKGKSEYHNSTEEPFLRVVWNSEWKAGQQPVPLKRPGQSAERKSRHAWRGRGRRKLAA